jgi:DNA-binding LacI/PurR family transcriptional regulator
MATMMDVAALARCSHQTVSRVINGKSARPDTIRRVRYAVAALGYEPNFAAQGLARRDSSDVEVVYIDQQTDLYVLVATIAALESDGTAFRVTTRQQF